MNAIFKNKFSLLLKRFQKLDKCLSSSSVFMNKNKFKTLSKEYYKLRPIIICYQEYIKIKNNINYLNNILKDDDCELSQIAKEEININTNKLISIKKKLQQYIFIENQEEDMCNVYLEIRAGTGGRESAIFVGDLFKMYSNYIISKGWNMEIISSRYSDHGGYKEIIIRIIGKSVYSKLKFESGVHRVQRIPNTESQGRIHTSACTVAILPEIKEIDNIKINNEDLRIDTFRASGAGGQHVNKTDSAIRITHIPTNLVVECQDERSQHKNRAKALNLLKTKILSIEKDKQRTQQAKTRKSLIGSGDRSERIRTYNFPKVRLTDHRINLICYRLDEIMNGKLDYIIDALKQEYYKKII